MKHLIYDLPTRLFHWSFAALFAGAFFVAKTVDDESPVFAWHMLAGLLLGAAVVLRIGWGIVGSRYARFSQFALNPKDLVSYMKGVFTGVHQRWPAHNPASSWAALAMMGFALGLAVTGWLMTSGGDTEAWEDIHELLANGFLVTALVHVAGVVFHMIRHRDQLGLSMIHGKKDGVGEGIQSSHRVAAIFGAVLFAVFALYLVQNYTPSTRKLQFFGTQLTLGESEDEGGDRGEEGKDEREDDDD